MTCIVKGCKMPAPNRKPVRVRKDSTGRRLTSLEGGNRGMLPRSHGRQSRYGDLSFDFLVQGGKVTRHRAVSVHGRVGCIPKAPVCLFTVRVKERKSMPSTKRSPYRIRAIIVRQARCGGDSHDLPMLTGGARGSCPPRKVSMIIIGAPQSGQT